MSYHQGSRGGYNMKNNQYNYYNNNNYGNNYEMGYNNNYQNKKNRGEKKHQYKQNFYEQNEYHHHHNNQYNIHNNNNNNINNNNNQFMYQEEEIEPQEEKPKIEYDKYLFFPGEQYDYEEDLFNEEIFKFKNGNLLTKKPILLYKAIENSNNENIENPTEENNKNKNDFYISIGKIYNPSINDIVVGIVTQKFADFYKIDIGSYTNAMLLKVNTDGNKNSKLEAEVGDIIIAKVISVNPNDCPLLSTENPKNKINVLTFCDINLGKVIGGTYFNIPIGKVKYLNKHNTNLKTLKNNVNFNICIGNNGRVYINNSDNNVLIISSIYKIILKCLEKENVVFSQEEITQFLVDSLQYKIS